MVARLCPIAAKLSSFGLKDLWYSLKIASKLLIFGAEIKSFQPVRFILRLGFVGCLGWPDQGCP
jgi:hypothetical protein